MVPTDELEGFRRGRRLRAAAAAAAAAAVAAWVLYTVLQPAPVERRARSLPRFELRLLGRPGTLTYDDVRGHPLVLNFWASWCVPCREEMPRLESAWRRYRADGIRFVGVNVRDLENEAREFVDELGITFPIVRDPDLELARALGVDDLGLPVTFFVDSSGRFEGVGAGRRVSRGRGTIVLGALSQRELEANIGKLLDR